MANMGNRPFAEGDLRRRLLCRVGRPLAASTENMGEESIAQLSSLVSDIYGTVRARMVPMSVPQMEPNGAVK